MSVLEELQEKVLEAGFPTGYVVHNGADNSYILGGVGVDTHTHFDSFRGLWMFLDGAAYMNHTLAHQTEKIETLLLRLKTVNGILTNGTYTKAELDACRFLTESIND